MIEKLPADIIRAHKGISFVGISVAFICYDSEANVFFAKRSSKARDEHGRWDCGGGGLRAGESISTTLQRELREEYNVSTILSSTPLGYYELFRESPNGTPTHWLILPFAIAVDRSEVRIMEPEMFEDSGWFRLDNLPKPLHSAWADLLPEEFWNRLRRAIIPKQSNV